MTILFQATLFILLIFNVNQSYALPNCKDVDYFNNCVATSIYDNGDQYVGEWKDNKKHGQGTYTFGSGSEWSGGKYVGEWKDDKQHGQGTYTIHNGDKYVGEFKNAEFHGQGTYTHTNGDKYVGEFKDNKKHGQGTYTRHNGDKYVGIWENDNYVESKIVKHTEKVETEKNQKQYSNNKMFSIGMGSGFFVNNEGFFVTNAHVINLDCRAYKAKFDGVFHKIDILTNDVNNDLAIGRLSHNNTQTDYLHLSEGAELGEDIIVAGFPLSSFLRNDSIKITRGIVSSLSGLENNFSELQIDAALQPGNSGGPIVNMKGEVVGVSTYVINPTKNLNPQNVNFGKKVELVNSLLKSNQIKNYRAKKNKEKSSKQVASILKNSTINLFCENTESQWKELAKMKKINEAIVDVLDFIK